MACPTWRVVRIAVEDARRYRLFYKVGASAAAAAPRATSNRILTTRQVGQAMLAVARRGYAKAEFSRRGDIRGSR